IRVSDEVRIEGSNLVLSGVPVSQNVNPGIQTFGGFAAVTGILAGDGPSILINANSFSIRGGQAKKQANRQGPGAARKIEINADTVTLGDNAALGAINQFAGPGTPVTVNSRTVNLSGDPNPDPKIFTAIFSNSDFNPLYGQSFGTPLRRQFLSDHALADS